MEKLEQLITGTEAAHKLALLEPTASVLHALEEQLQSLLRILSEGEKRSAS